jgi:hypothetical protein
VARKATHPHHVIPESEDSIDPLVASTPTRKKINSADQMLTPSTSSIQTPHTSSFISSVTQFYMVFELRVQVWVREG